MPAHLLADGLLDEVGDLPGMVICAVVCAGRVAIGPDRGALDRVIYAVKKRLRLALGLTGGQGRRRRTRQGRDPRLSMTSRSLPSWIVPDLESLATPSP